MTIKNTLLRATLSLVAGVTHADQVISSFEGDLSSVYGVNWTTIESGIRSTAFIADDPNDLDSEGVTEGTQALELGFRNWDSGNQPWLVLQAGTATAQSILEFDAFAFDMTPVANLAGPGIAYRQAFLAATSNTLNFGFIQRDFSAEDAEPDPTQNPDTGAWNPSTLSWDLNELLEENDNGPTGVFKTWKQWAREAVDAGPEEGFFDLYIIFQGANNDFFEFPPKVAIDNVRWVGAGAPGVTGDYNNDGVVDAADYTVYRDNLGGPATAFPNRDPGIAANPISMDDYVAWDLAYGSPAPTAGVPEPTSALMALAALAASRCARRR